MIYNTKILIGIVQSHALIVGYKNTVKKAEQQEIAGVLDCLKRLKIIDKTVFIIQI